MTTNKDMPDKPETLHDIYYLNKYGHSNTGLIIGCEEPHANSTVKFISEEKHQSHIDELTQKHEAELQQCTCRNL